MNPAPTTNLSAGAVRFKSTPTATLLAPTVRLNCNPYCNNYNGTKSDDYYVGRQVTSCRNGTIHEVVVKSGDDDSADFCRTEWVVKIRTRNTTDDLINHTRNSFHHRRYHRQYQSNIDATLHEENQLFHTLLNLSRGEAFFPRIPLLHTTNRQLQAYGQLSTDSRKDYLIMERMDAELFDVLPEYIIQESCTSDRIDVGSVACRLIRITEQIHKACHVLVSIQPSNIMIRKMPYTCDTTEIENTFAIPNNPESSQFADEIRLVGLGLARPYCHPDGVHKENKVRKQFIGTLPYSGLNIHKRNSPSRRDDIESALYIIGEMVIRILNMVRPDDGECKATKAQDSSQSCLPWSIKGRSADYVALMKYNEASNFESRYYQSMPREVAEILFECWKKVRAYKYEDTPEYSFFNAKLRSLCIPIPYCGNTERECDTMAPIQGAAVVNTHDSTSVKKMNKTVLSSGTETPIFISSSFLPKLEKDFQHIETGDKKVSTRTHVDLEHFFEIHWEKKTENLPFLPTDSTNMLEKHTDTCHDNLDEHSPAYVLSYECPLLDNKVQYHNDTSVKDDISESDFVAAEHNQVVLFNATNEESNEASKFISSDSDTMTDELKDIPIDEITVATTSQDLSAEPINGVNSLKSVENNESDFAAAAHNQVDATNEGANQESKIISEGVKMADEFNAIPIDEMADATPCHDISSQPKTIVNVLEAGYEYFVNDENQLMNKEFGASSFTNYDETINFNNNNPQRKALQEIEIPPILRTGESIQNNQLIPHRSGTILKQPMSGNRLPISSPVSTFAVVNTSSSRSKHRMLMTHTSNPFQDRNNLLFYHPFPSFPWNMGVNR